MKNIAFKIEDEFHKNIKIRATEEGRVSKSL